MAQQFDANAVGQALQTLAQQIPLAPPAFVNIAQGLQDIQQQLAANHAQTTADLAQVTARLQIIEQNQQYAEHKAIARAFNSNIVAGNAPLFKINLPNQDQPHPRFPATKAGVERLAVNTMDALLAAYNVVIAAGASLQRKKEVFLQFIGVPV